MTVVGAFSGSGVETIPAGKCKLSLQVNTEQRTNVSGATFSITATGKSYTATADASGRAEILVDSGYTYTITLTHSGTYTNDGPQTVLAESTTIKWVYFELRTAKFSTVSATLLASGWASNTQTISVTGVLASSTVVASPAPVRATVEAYSDAEILCIGQANGTLTFSCTETPSADIGLSIVVMNE